MPEWKEPIRARLAGLKLSPTRELEIVEELAQHAEDRYIELRNDGVTEDEARRISLEETTGRELHAAALENARERRLLTGLGHDVHYGLRAFLRDPGFAALVMLVLALGIGANTAIFSVVNGILLQPLAYPDPSKLVNIAEAGPEFSRFSVAYPNYLDWRSESRSFSDMAIYRLNDFNFTGSGEPETLSGLHVSTSLLPVLGVKPALGRDFLPGEGKKGAACSTLISYGFWRRRFGGDPDVLGRSLTLNAIDCRVIGVLPGNLRFEQGAEVYVPIEQWNSIELYTRSSHPGLQVIARLRKEVSLDQAQAEIAAISSRLSKEYPESNAGHSARIASMKEDMVGYIRPTLLLLMCAVGFVLVIACANVANLLLARSTARKREFAIRMAIGAESGRIVRQLLTESFLLSVAAGVAGLLIAHWAIKLILAVAPGHLPRAAEIGIDWPVLLFALAISMATGILFGLFPALRSAAGNPQDSLKEGARGAGGGRYRAETVFVAIEVALAVVLLVGAGLMIRSIWRLLEIHPGIDVHNVLTMDVALSPKAMGSPTNIRLAYRQMLQRVDAIPGVESAAVTNLVPLGENDNEDSFWIGNGPQPPQDRLKSAVFYVVTPDYLKTMRIPLLRGRFFTERDLVSTTPVTVIDEVLAKHYFPGQDPLGRQVSLMGLGPTQIVGIAAHVKQWGLDADDTNKIRDQIYFPFMQVPDKYTVEGGIGVTLLVRTGRNPVSFLSAIRTQVAGPTRDQPVYAVKTMERVVSSSLSERHFAMTVLIAFSGTALFLAAIGIYGVMSYAVTRRFHEMGIRSALGASRGEILTLVLSEGMKLTALGMAGGLAASLLLSQFMAKLLYGIAPADPVTLVGVSGLLAAIALAACYVPARRATAVDPLIALRWE